MKKWLVWIVLLCVVSLASGCAMMGMHGMGLMGDQHGGGEEPIVVHLKTEDTSAVLEVPPLVAGEPAVLSVRLNRMGDDTPIVGALVFVEVIDIHRGGSRRVYHSNNAPAIKANESAAGVYQLSHKFARQGQYEIIAEVHLGNSEGGKHLVLSARQQVVAHSGHIGHRRSVSRDAAYHWFIL